MVRIHQGACITSRPHKVKGVLWLHFAQAFSGKNNTSDLTPEISDGGKGINFAHVELASVSADEVCLRECTTNLVHHLIEHSSTSHQYVAWPCEKIKAKNIQQEKTCASSCPSTAKRRLCTTERYLKAEKTFRGENEIQSKAVTEEHLIDVAKQILQPPPTPPAEVERIEFWHLIPATCLRLAKFQNKFMI